MKLPSKIYFHISDAGKFGRIIRELQISEAGDIGKAAQSVDDDTIGFCLLEDGIETDVSEDVAREWVRLNSSTIEFVYGEPVVPQFIITHASEQLAQIEGEIAVERMNNTHHSEHIYAA